MMAAGRKTLEWVASSRRDLKGFPEPVREVIGFALFVAEQGGKHRDAKPLKRLGSGVLEIVARHHGDAYRGVYTVRFAQAIYVLHVFQKKSKKGVEPPQPDIDLVKQRLKDAERHYASKYGKEPKHG